MTTQILIVLASTIFAIAAFISMLGVAQNAAVNSTAERLREMGAPEPEEPGNARRAPQSLEEIELSKPFAQRVVEPLLRSALRILGRTIPGSNAEALILKLARAGVGSRLSGESYVGIKLATAVGSAAVAMLMQVVLPPLIPPPNPITTAVWSLMGGVAGFFLPDLWLRDRTKQRQKAITRALPDTLDVLSISVEAGLGFDSALGRICQKSQGPLTDEFEQYLTEMRLGKGRREALRQIEARTGVEDLHTFINALIQADQLGVSIGKVLRLQSEQLRVRRRQRAEQLAQQAPLKMLFPMILFIFPSIFVVILGPAIRQLMHL
jgi:tight adherence protein C